MYTYKGILFSFKKGNDSNICYDMSGSEEFLLTMVTK